MTGQTYLDNETWRYFWHPVCTMEELEKSDIGRGALVQARLLGSELVIARLNSQIVAMNNRCPHRSAKLHLGWNRGDSIQCAYHGWQYGADGQCIAIPAAPDGPIPKRARATTYDCEVKYGLIWVRLDSSAETQIPAHIAFDNPEFKCVLGPCYDWKTHAARRLENFTDLAHFPFVHPQTLGSAGHVTFLVPASIFANRDACATAINRRKGHAKRWTRREISHRWPLAIIPYRCRLE